MFASQSQIRRNRAPLAEILALCVTVASTACATDAVVPVDGSDDVGLRAEDEPDDKVDEKTLFNLRVEKKGRWENVYCSTDTDEVMTSGVNGDTISHKWSLGNGRRLYDADADKYLHCGQENGGKEPVTCRCISESEDPEMLRELVDYYHRTLASSDDRLRPSWSWDVTDHVDYADMMAANDASSDALPTDPDVRFYIAPSSAMNTCLKVLGDTIHSPCAPRAWRQKDATCSPVSEYLEDTGDFELTDFEYREEDLDARFEAAYFNEEDHAKPCGLFELEPITER